MLGTVSIQELFALHTEPCFERILRVIEAGVNDLLIARTGMRADRFGRLEHNDLASA